MYFCYNNVKITLKFYINVKFSTQGFYIKKILKLKILYNSRAWQFFEIVSLSVLFYWHQTWQMDFNNSFKII